MGRLRQFYGGTSVPLRIDRDEDAPARAWHAHRTRLRSWLAAVPDAEWKGRTRCDLWDVTALVRHLVSGSQFLGYTLNKATQGTSTDLMRDFDTHLTVRADAERFGSLTPDDARDLLASKDASVDAELADARRGNWCGIAEAPPGNVPAHVAVNHFLLDSWVHEYDLLLPRNEAPSINPLEAETVVSYLIGLASVEVGSHQPIDLRLTEPDLQIGLDVDSEITHVAFRSVPSGAAIIEGRAVDLVDRATGRQGGLVVGDIEALAVLDGFGALLAS